MKNSFYIMFGVVMLFSSSVSAHNCKDVDLTPQEKQKYSDYDNIFAEEIPWARKRNECLKNEIKKEVLQKLGEEHWQNIEKQLDQLEPKYVNLYRTVRCPTWPGCPKSGEVFPYLDYYSLLNKLLWDLQNFKNNP